MTSSEDRVPTASPAASPPVSPSVSPAPVRRRSGKVKLAVAAGVLAVAAAGGGTYAVLNATDTSSAAAVGPGGGPGGADGADANGMRGGGPPSGTVVSTTATTITVSGTDGTETTYTLADGATVQDDGATVALTDLIAGEQVVIFTGQPGSDSTEATRVLAGTSAQVGPGDGAGGAQPGSDG